jgi:hypothetical protein
MAKDPKDLDPRAARLGEIVEASTTVWRAVAPRTFEAPAFGSFVKTSDGSRTVYGVVSHVQHASIDPSRKAIPLGRSWAELEREQPQVRELLTTEFDAIVVAFAEESDTIHAFLPPLPPRVHDFVEACTAEEIVELTEDRSFIRTLGASGLPVVGELIAAAIRAAAMHRDDQRAFLVSAGREVADLFRMDYELASSIIRRIRVPDAAPSKAKR